MQLGRACLVELRSDLCYIYVCDMCMWHVRVLGDIAVTTLPPEAIELKEEVETHSGQRVRDDANVDASSMCDVELDA